MPGVFFEFFEFNKNWKLKKIYIYIKGMVDFPWSSCRIVIQNMNNNLLTLITLPKWEWNGIV